MRVCSWQVSDECMVSVQEAAQVLPDFFYVSKDPSIYCACVAHHVIQRVIHCFPQETVAPLLIVGTTTLLAISTLTSEVNFYTRWSNIDQFTDQIETDECVSTPGS